MLGRLLLLSGLICSPLLLLPRGLWILIFPAIFLVLSGIAGALSKQFSQIYRLRYLEGRPEVALKRLRLWRLLLPREQLKLIEAEALLQAGRVDEVEKLRTGGSLPAWLSHHLGFMLARQRKDYRAAEESLRQLLASQPPKTQKVAAQAEMARLLAEFFPERLSEAESMLALAREGVEPGTMATIVDGIQGILEVAGLKAEDDDPTENILAVHTRKRGIVHLREAAEKLGTTEVLTLPFVSEFHRWMGRAYAALDQPHEAREELLTARTLTRLPSLIEACDADLAALRV